MDRKRLVEQSIDYMMGHLGERLSLDRLAAQFYVSKYHFCRIFKEETGETVHAFLKRSRMDQSAVDLKLNPTKALTEIGLDYGYSASNYSSAFRERHDTAPSRFRRSLPTGSMAVPFAPERVARFQTAEAYGAKIQILELDDLFVAYERWIGSYADIEDHWYGFLDRNKALLTEQTVLVERFFHDPAITNPSQCICDLGMTVEPGRGLDHVMRIRGGKWLVYRFQGEIKDIFETVQGVFAVWLPQSGYQMTRRYGLHLYRRIDRERHRVVMDLCIPIS